MTQPAAATALAAPRTSLPAAILEASKPRITRLVTITSGVGFVIAALPRSWDLLPLALTAAGALLGTALSAAGANALNQWMERDRDALMPRTCDRPLPTRRLTPETALAAGSFLVAAGLVTLWSLCGAAPALVSLATVLIYLLIYTPLKPITPLATLVGAIPGALPPLIGWTAAGGPRSIADPGALILFSIMFIWQIPHFLAIAWMYRDDYRAGGYKVLPVVDLDGRRTARSMLAWSLLLIPAAAAPALLMRPAAAIPFAALALAMGAAYVWLAWRVVAGRQRSDARRAFIASVVHLPLLLMLMVAGAVASRLML